MPPKSSTKASAAPADAPARTYKEHDTVLGKIKGYPPWPGRVVAPENANEKVTKEKPKKGTPTLVQFFPTGDFAWLGPKDISALKKEEIEKVLATKKKGELFQGYKIAQDPSEWITEKEDEAAEIAQLQEDLEDDQLASEGEGAGPEVAKGKAGKVKKEATKKRKRDTAADKAGKGENGQKKDDKKKAKKETGKTKAGVKKDYTDDEAEPASKKSKASGDSDAETVKGWRHKLQKIFLGKTSPPADEMPKCAEIFDAMEKFEMQKEWLIESKLAKVLKRIAILKENVIPEDDKYDFRKRSAELASKWAAIMEGNSAGSPQPESNSAAAADNSTDAAPASNTENGTEAAPAASDAAAPAADSTEEKKEEPEPMQVDTNGDDKAEEPKLSEEEPKKVDEETPAPAAEESTA
ncbi:hypothetical protein JCM16303_000801 [Sporobolomyces ruberrimus]